MKFEELNFKDISTRRREGIQAEHRFENGYGVSVIQLFHICENGEKMPLSYGSQDGLYEVAVTKNGNICGDVHGYLDETGVEKLLIQIEAL